MRALIDWFLSRIHSAEPAERGQAIILVAITLPVLLMMVGAAVEGGNVLVQYRQMQVAADMAALTGAQNLPCNVGDTTCEASATSRACTYAADNGYASGNGNGTCSNTGSDPSITVSAYAPPQSCSPYNFIDYGNGNGDTGGNNNCMTGTSPSTVTYIEVQVTKSLTVPIFNKTFTLSTHAVARYGVGALGGFAIYALDPNGTLNGGSINAVGSVWSNGNISGGTACDGGFYAAGTASGATTYSGSPIYAPFDEPSGLCTGSADATAKEGGGLPQLQDPYGSTTAPPSSSGSFPNCTLCLQQGWQYDLSSKSWTQGGTISGSKNGVEVFPGSYSAVDLGNKAWVMFNPGVYTITGGFATNHGAACVFGAADCGDGGTCADGGSTGSVQAGTAAANQYEYQCSPWGFWDTTLACSSTSPIKTNCAAPTFWNESTGAASTIPLNGVTFYFPSGDAGVTLHGNGGGSNNGGFYLAAPNACPGTGSSWSVGSSVPFPTGYNGAYFNFKTAGSIVYSDSGYATTPSPSTNYVYPSMDYSQAGECSPDPYMIWPDEFGTGNTQSQHTQFLFWSRSSSAGLDCSGDDNMTWYGIFYDPDATLKTTGACGKKANDPWLVGQIVVDDVDTNGASNLGVDYRQCGAGDICNQGPGTELIQ